MNLIDGEEYNFIGQDEVIIYIGYNHDGGWWHQFALKNKPGIVWCELSTSDLSLIEKH